jgi:hypothetical protein
MARWSKWFSNARGGRSSIQRARLLSNSIKFVFDLWRLRESTYEGIEDGRYVCMLKSDWGNFSTCSSPGVVRPM